MERWIPAGYTSVNARIDLLRVWTAPRVRLVARRAPGGGLFLRSRVKSRFDRVQATEQSSPRWLAKSVADLAQPFATDRPSPIYFAAIFCWTMTAVSAVMVTIVRWPLGSPHWFVF